MKTNIGDYECSKVVIENIPKDTSHDMSTQVRFGKK